MTGKLVNSLDFAREFTRVEDARVVADPGEIQWDEEADFVVVGYGGAGVAAANQASDGGLDVVALDRNEGGGATKMNGGIMYLGGGTWVQKESGYEDTPEEMFIYLKRELRDVVTDETLRRFCESGPETVRWLEKHGVEFKATAYPTKTMYPSPGYYLYHPDNSLLKRFRTNARPSPRGHRAVSEVTTTAVGAGIGIFRPQNESAKQAGVRVYGQCDVRQMIVDQKGAVVGVKARRVPSGTAAHAALVKAQVAMNKWLFVLPTSYPGGKLTFGIAQYYGRKAARIEAEHARDFYVRARKGVCISSGGFIFNTEMLRRYAPECANVMPLGTPADDGSGILLGHSAGGAMSQMEQISIWRHMSPPNSWPKNMVVDVHGERFVDEGSYGADVGREMMRPQTAGVAWLILDQKMWKQAKSDLKDIVMAFQKVPAAASMMFGTKKAPTLEALCKKVGINYAGLSNTLETYRRAAAGEIPDPFDKDPETMVVPTEGPFYAVDVSINTPWNPAYAITVGGLLVDERSGLVMRDDGSTIPGLYAAGRTAIGLCTYLYLSGMSAGDCIFSGRRAGQHASDPAVDHSASHQGLSAVWPDRHVAAA